MTEKKTFIFRGRDLLVNAALEPADVQASSVIAEYTDLVSGNTGIAVSQDFTCPEGTVFLSLREYFASRDEEKAALAAGKDVVSLANQQTERNIELGWWYMTEQMGAALKDHPVLARFPHEGIFEPQFFRIGKTGLALPVEGFAKDDFVMVGEGGKGCYLYLAVARRPNGARHGLVAGLDVLSDTAEGTAILDGMLAPQVR